jgi:hypothetical protein
MKEKVVMSERFRPLALITLVLAVGSFVAASAVAKGPRKDFGPAVIQKVSGNELMVDNRMGDKLKFKPAGEVPVSGEGKTSWGELKRGDWVLVTWEMFDKPRIAYEVKVVPEKKEAGEDL